MYCQFQRNLRPVELVNYIWRGREAIKPGNTDYPDSQSNYILVMTMIYDFLRGVTIYVMAYLPNYYTL